MLTLSLPCLRHMSKQDSQADPGTREGLPTRGHLASGPETPTGAHQVFGCLLV